MMIDGTDTVWSNLFSAQTCIVELAIPQAQVFNVTPDETRTLAVDDNTKTCRVTYSPGPVADFQSVIVQGLTPNEVDACWEWGRRGSPTPSRMPL